MKQRHNIMKICLIAFLGLGTYGFTKRTNSVTPQQANNNLEECINIMDSPPILGWRNNEQNTPPMARAVCHGLSDCTFTFPTYTSGSLGPWLVLATNRYRAANCEGLPSTDRGGDGYAPSDGKIKPPLQPFSAESLQERIVRHCQEDDVSIKFGVAYHEVDRIPWVAIDAFISVTGFDAEHNSVTCSVRMPTGCYPCPNARASLQKTKKTKLQ